MRRLLSAFLLLAVLTGCTSLPAPEPGMYLLTHLVEGDAIYAYDDPSITLVLYSFSGYDMVIFRALNDSPADDF